MEECEYFSKYFGDNYCLDNQQILLLSFYNFHFHRFYFAKLSLPIYLTHPVIANSYNFFF